MDQYIILVARNNDTLKYGAMYHNAGDRRAIVYGSRDEAFAAVCEFRKLEAALGENVNRWICRADSLLGKAVIAKQEAEEAIRAFQVAIQSPSESYGSRVWGW